MEQFDEEPVVHEHGQVEVVAHFAAERGVVALGCKLLGATQGSPLGLVLARGFGIFDLPVSPAARGGAGAVAPAVAAAPTGGAAPVVGLVQTATRPVGVRLDHLRLFAVDSLAQIVDSLVTAVEEDFDQAAARGGPGVFHRMGIVRGRGYVLPQVLRHAVAHPRGVDGHGVEYPVIVRSQAAQGYVLLLPVFVHHLQPYRPLSVAQGVVAAPACLDVHAAAAALFVPAQQGVDKGSTRQARLAQAENREGGKGGCGAGHRVAVEHPGQAVGAAGRHLREAGFAAGLPLAVHVELRALGSSGGVDSGLVVAAPYALVHGEEAGGTALSAALFAETAATVQGKLLQSGLHGGQGFAAARVGRLIAELGTTEVGHDAPLAVYEQEALVFGGRGAEFVVRTHDIGAAAYVEQEVLRGLAADDQAALSGIDVPARHLAVVGLRQAYVAPRGGAEAVIGQVAPAFGMADGEESVGLLRQGPVAAVRLGRRTGDFLGIGGRGAYGQLREGQGYEAVCLAGFELYGTGGCGEGRQQAEYQGEESIHLGEGRF